MTCDFFGKFSVTNYFFDWFILHQLMNLSPKIHKLIFKKMDNLIVRIWGFFFLIPILSALFLKKFDAYNIVVFWAKFHHFYWFLWSKIHYNICKKNWFFYPKIHYKISQKINKKGLFYIVFLIPDDDFWWCFAQNTTENHHLVSVKIRPIVYW